MNYNFSSKSISFDFVAYHDLQAQAGESVFEAMSHHFNCRWLIGPNQKPTGAEAAIVLDHTQHQPQILKGKDSYKYLFYMSHDLGDINVYEIEKYRLTNFNIIFVPGPLHLKFAQQAFKFNFAQSYSDATRVILEAGWPKYDHLDIPEQYQILKNEIANLPYEHTVIYAPTRSLREWQDILPLICKLKCNLIIKNPIYVNPGDPFPPGLEEEYKNSLASAQEMEDYIRSYQLPNLIVAPRKLNICTLFPFADVLISDQSSVNIEFLPFGISIETGRYDENPNHLNPQSCLISDSVIFMRLQEIQSILSSETSLANFVGENANKKIDNPIIRPEIKNSGQLITMSIDKYLAFWQIFNSSLQRHSLFTSMTENLHNTLIDSL
ncbi:hypothetical protein HCG51_21845 [Tolypothrix sp. PCC 7910]|uniref:hypothetical protein n=1 Tax=Tolypothrix sp. PCC 7910 TaxID=2099387 RepID=UPI0014279484|nr:hypothetical protein [Tolypothrix sp. PCC 7910]QIR39091.1 hypothetical protein HCG51_21845 [Tolypothrix sp. PCC 7910]